MLFALSLSLSLTHSVLQQFVIFLRFQKLKLCFVNNFEWNYLNISNKRVEVMDAFISYHFQANQSNYKFNLRLKYLYSVRYIQPNDF